MPVKRVSLREVEDADLDVFYANQQDPQSYAMAGFPSRDREAFLAHWAKIRADPSVVSQTILADGRVAGDIGSWEQDGRRELGYWINRNLWGQGVATQAVALFLDLVPERPLHAHVVVHNTGSIRVLEKCGFRRDGPSVVAPDGVEEWTYVLT